MPEVVDVQEKYDLKPRMTAWEVGVLGTYADALKTLPEVPNQGE